MIVLNILYLFIISYAFGLYFNKKFYESLTPSIILHGLITLVSWFIFDDMRIGCYSYIFFSLIYVLYCIFMDIFINKRLNFDWFKDKTIIVFLLMFIYLCIINYGRRFFHWDEYSHWGMFIKETFRLNQYFSVSTLPFSHKDYVSFTTIIIYNFLKVAGKFTEPLCFTAMTIFLFSMILPIFSYIKFDKNRLLSTTNFKSSIFIAFLFLLPYFHPFTYFYISVMSDAAGGITLFYCLYLVCSRSDNNDKYYLFILTLSFVALSLVRMDGFAYIPIVLFFMFLQGKQKPVYYIIPVTISIALWGILNIYISRHVSNTSVQGYGSIRLSEIFDVITLNTQKIPYIKDLLSNYLTALINNNSFFRVSYIASGLVIIIIVSLFGYIARDNKLFTMSCGIFFAHIYKVDLMFFLYATRFSKEEAVAIASYDRYMSSFVICMYFYMAYLVIKHYYDVKCKTIVSILIAAYICILVYNAYVVAKNVDFKNKHYSKAIEVVSMFQYCPGFITKQFRYGIYDNDKYSKISDELESLYGNNKKVLLIMSTQNYANWVSSTILQYYVDGYPVDKVYLDKQNNNELLKKLNNYDYLFTINDAETISMTNVDVMQAVDSNKLENLAIVQIKSTNISSGGITQ